MSALKVHTSHDFVEMDIPEKIKFGENVAELMLKSIAIFKNPTVSLILLLEANDLLSQCYDAWLKNPSLDEDMYNAESAWIIVFSQDATYIDSVANGNAAIIALSGYHKTKDTRDKAQMLEAPIIKFQKSTNPRGFDNEIAVQKKADAYCSLIYTNDLTTIFNDNQIVFTKINEDKTITQISIVVSKKRKAKHSYLIRKSDMKSQSTVINSAGMIRPSAPTEQGIL